MKKSYFASLTLSVIGALFLGIGMCMCLLPEWELYSQGIVVGAIGLLFFLITIIIYRKMEHKAPMKITGKGFLSFAIGIAGISGLGVGMCLTMVYNQFVSGIAIGIAGIIFLLGLIPLCKGLK